MKDKFDGLAENLVHARHCFLTCSTVCLVLAVEFAAPTLPALANDFQRGPLVLLSSPNLLAGCNNGGTVLRPATTWRRHGSRRHGGRWRRNPKGLTYIDRV